ncbi:MAG TPA: hypothetical protein VFV66_31965 [Nonomuraea sp.]|nr:hypothetical protein [Nonomuraea sp.]
MLSLLRIAFAVLTVIAFFTILFTGRLEGLIAGLVIATAVLLIIGTALASSLSHSKHTARVLSGAVPCDPLPARGAAVQRHERTKARYATVFRHCPAPHPLDAIEA